MQLERREAVKEIFIKGLSFAVSQPHRELFNLTEPLPEIKRATNVVPMEGAL